MEKVAARKEKATANYKKLRRALTNKGLFTNGSCGRSTFCGTRFRGRRRYKIMDYVEGSGKICEPGEDGKRQGKMEKTKQRAEH